MGWEVFWDDKFANNTLVWLEAMFGEQLTQLTYPLCLQVCPSEAMVVLIEIHHLEAVELVRHFLDFLFFPGLLDFDTFSVPRVGETLVSVYVFRKGM